MGRDIEKRTPRLEVEERSRELRSVVVPSRRGHSEYMDTIVFKRAGLDIINVGLAFQGVYQLTGIIDMEENRKLRVGRVSRTCYFNNIDIHRRLPGYLCQRKVELMGAHRKSYLTLNLGEDSHRPLERCQEKSIDTSSSRKTLGVSIVNEDPSVSHRMQNCFYLFILIFLGSRRTQQSFWGERPTSITSAPSPNRRSSVTRFQVPRSRSIMPRRSMIGLTSELIPWLICIMARNRTEEQACQRSCQAVNYDDWPD